MDYRNKIFEMLGVEPEEEFLFKTSTYHYKFDNELNIFSKDKDKERSYVDAELEYLQDILKGRLKIKKIVKPTPEDEIIFAYGRLCDYSWVVVNENGTAYFTMEKPQRSELGDFWDTGVNYNHIEADISCLSWKDEPYYIGNEEINK